MSTPDRDRKIQQLVTKADVRRRLGVQLSRPGLDVTGIQARARALYQGVPVSVDLPDLPPEKMQLRVGDEKSPEPDPQAQPYRAGTPFSVQMRIRRASPGFTPEEEIEERTLNLFLQMREDAADHYSGRRLSIGSDFTQYTRNRLESKGGRRATHPWPNNCTTAGYQAQNGYQSRPL